MPDTPRRSSRRTSATRVDSPTSRNGSSTTQPTAGESPGREVEAAEAAYAEAWTQLVANWKTGLAEVQATVAEVNEVCQRLFLDWHQVDPSRWEPPRPSRRRLRFGEYAFDLAQIPQGISSDPRLKPEDPRISPCLPCSHSPAEGRSC